MGGKAFPDDGGFLQQNKTPRHQSTTYVEHKFKLVTFPPNFPDLNPINHLRNVLDKHVQTIETLHRYFQDFKDLLPACWR